jgi:hypothetical protein
MLAISTQAWVVMGLTTLGFIVVGLLAYVNMKRLSWPKGDRLTRTSVLGVELIVIDPPGSDGERLLLLDACQTATTAMFTAWRSWRPGDAGAETVFPRIGVHFADDELVDQIGAAMFGKRIAAYLTDVSSAFERVPLAIIRKSLAKEMIGTGQPLMHELLHALLNHFTPDAPGNKDHTGQAWDFVQNAAVVTFRDLYSPTTQLQRVAPKKV